LERTRGTARLSELPVWVAVDLEYIDLEHLGVVKTVISLCHTLMAYYGGLLKVLLPLNSSGGIWRWLDCELDFCE